MENRREGERIEQAMIVYEDVRMVLERLRDIDANLDDPLFEQYKVSVRAKEHLSIANDSLTQLADLMRSLHMRPSEDSSDDPLQM